MTTHSAVRALARTAAVLSLTVTAAVGLAGPAAAGTPHVEHTSQGRCMGQAISAGAVLGGPRAVALHHHALKGVLAEEDLKLGHVWRTVAALPSC